MASYKSAFDPTPRPGNATIEKRTGTYWQPTLERQEAVKFDPPTYPRKMEARRGHTIPQPGSSQPSGLPRPNMRSPSPSTKVMTDPQSNSHRFGFGKTSARATVSPPSNQSAPDTKAKTPRNVLRRKQSSVAEHTVTSKSLAERAGSTSPSKWSQISAETRPSIDASLRSNDAYSEIFVRTRTKTPVTNEPLIYPELDRYRRAPEQYENDGLVNLPPKLSTLDLPPTPLLSGTPLHSASSSSNHRYSGAYSGSGYSLSPSTRFSESPGPGAFSRNTTPTSISSQSPGILVPVKPVTPRLQQGSPAHTRPPVTKRRTGSSANVNDVGVAVDPQGLAALRESVTSSSSNSTVKVEHKTPDTKGKKKKQKLSPLPPSPPPRKSSQKFKKSPSTRPEESPTKASATPARPVMTSPTKAPPVMKPLVPTKSLDKTIPPTRPSRDGAPELPSQLGEPIMIIQSNLPSIPFASERRRSGIATRASPQIPQLTPRSTQGSRLPSRNPSPSPVQPIQREPTPALTGLGIIPDLRPQSAPKASGLRTPSPSVSTQKHRFGIFGRRKTAPEAVTVEKGARKGPAAGTGHEGYGRYAPRGRSISSNSVTSGRERSVSAASSSMESTSSTRTHDPFLLERMSPVIIAGGEVVENHNTNSELTRIGSNTSALSGPASVEAKGSSKSSLGKEIPRGPFSSSNVPRDLKKRLSTLPVPNIRRPSDSSDDGLNKTSLAFRRSTLKSNNNSSSALQLPKSLNTDGQGAGSSRTSLNTSLLSDDSIPKPPEVGRGRDGLITKSKKLEKRPSSPKKWGIFQRSKPKPESKTEVAVPVTMGREPVKAVPHYALMDSSDELPDYLEGVDLEELMTDFDVVDLSDTELDRLQFGELKANLSRERAEKEIKMKAAKANEEKLPTMLFNSPKPLKLTTKYVDIEGQLTKDDAPVRSGRLAQVGRIPKVIPARPQATSPKSFSRPFARLSITQPLLDPIVLDKESVAVGPSPPKPSAMFPQTNLQADIEAAIASYGGLNNDDATIQPADFLTFSPRKGSTVTTNSSSNISHSEIVTAVLPEPDAALAEDEVWNEYDDLIEKTPISPSSSCGVPFQYENYETRRIRQTGIEAPKESPTLTQAPKLNVVTKTTSDDIQRSSILTSSSIYSQEMNPRLKESLAAITTPTTPMSFTEFISGYGDRNNSVHGDSAKKPRRSSRSSSRKSDSEIAQAHKSALLPITELATPVEPAPVSQVNLRLASMTVSKWLTFGQVLFSPARESIEAAATDPSKRHSVLVIDGLGNDDWSFYAADIYPAATFYNLSPTRPLSASQRASSSSTFPHTPVNHRQVQYLSPSLRFPFPSATFHVVVFRFPPSLPLSSYQNVVNEAKRVLLPGGYLEMAILDVDMMNMGPRARRSVRALKMTMQSQEDKSVWTGSASDTVLKFIGKRGFESVKSCVVGVPVATPVSPTSSAISKGKEPEMSQQQDRSLADLIRDPHSSASDEHITSMVAKVGRWWYNRCYESASTDNGRASMFDDMQLVNESEEWNSSFKLVVAHARKPIAGGIRGGGMRRTSSV